MGMESITVTECKEGDILAEDLMNRHGAVMVVRNTTLNGYILFKLNELGIKRVKVYRDCLKNRYGDVSTIYRHIKDNYKESIADIRVIVGELAAGKPLNVKKVMDISNAVCCGKDHSCHVLRVLNEERDFDEYTYTHSLNVAFYAMLLGKWTGLKEVGINHIVLSGLLHDIGKIKVPIEILNKKSRLSVDEFETIKKHSTYGFEMVKETNHFPKEVCEAVLLYHERIDKSGYPFGIGGEQINHYAKIIAIADVYDAMASDRVYKKRANPFEIFNMFKTVGVKNFEPKILNTFLINLSACYVGSKVMLDTGEIGEIAYIPPQSITKPVICIGRDYIDLAVYKEKAISCMI